MRPLTSKIAQAALSAAALHARALGIRICAAAVDADGSLVAFVRMDGAPPHHAALAMDKAYVAASTGMSTAERDQLLLADKALRADFATRLRMVVFGGGVPMHYCEWRVGGIGVAGGSPDEDTKCARAAIAAVGMTDTPR